ncbi:hypothetical protein BN949_05041 [Agrobacterium tumefaciens]|nr:hypothetical protein BN949_05041 [Agrobacterium tumefaciens]
MDTATGDVCAVGFTSNLLDQIPPDVQISNVAGDGVFDMRRCHTAILESGGTAVTPIRKNERRWREDCPAAVARNEILRATQPMG